MANRTCKHGNHCLLCNKGIASRGPLSSFRTVFAAPDDNWSAAHLSTPSTMGTWTHGIPGYSNQVTTQYCLCQPSNAAWTVAQSYKFFRRALNGQRPQNVVWVFPFHDKCWTTLQAASERIGIAVDLQALYQVAMSLHFEDWVLNLEFLGIELDLFAHRALQAQANGPPPARPAIQTPGSCSAFDTFVPYRRLKWRSYVEQDHCDRVELEVRRRSRDVVGHGVITRFWERTDKDVFAKLPEEIHIDLFSFLEFSDLRNLRLASSACAAVAITDSFFERMFSPYGRFGYLHPFAWDYFPTSDTKWGKTVACALKLRGNKAIEERQTVWKSSLELLQLIKVRAESPICYGKDIYHRLADKRNANRPPRQRWQIKYPGEDPKPMKRWIYLPQPLGEVRASTMRLKERTFITGLRFISKRNEKVELGYIHPKSEITIWRSGRSTSPRVYNFDVATDAMGIRGIRAVSNTREILWAGHYDEDTMEKSRVAVRRLNIRRGYSESFLTGYFDHLKLLELH